LQILFGNSIVKGVDFDLKEVFVMQVVFLFIGCILGAISIFFWRGNK